MSPANAETSLERSFTPSPARWMSWSAWSTVRSRFTCSSAPMETFVIDVAIWPAETAISSETEANCVAELATSAEVCAATDTTRDSESPV